MLTLDGQPAPTASRSFTRLLLFSEPHGDHIQPEMYATYQRTLNNFLTGPHTVAGKHFQVPGRTPKQLDNEKQ